MDQQTIESLLGRMALQIEAEREQRIRLESIVTTHARRFERLEKIIAKAASPHGLAADGLALALALEAMRKTCEYRAGRAAEKLTAGLADRGRTARDRWPSDRLAIAVAAAIKAGHLDSRSPAGDALLDYLRVGDAVGPQDIPSAIAELKQLHAGRVGA